MDAGGDFGGSSQAGGVSDDRLRLAPDWSAVGQAMGGSVALQYLPGWTRPLRVGVFIGYSSFRPGLHGSMLQLESHVQTTGLMLHPGFQLVGLVEPGTEDRGLVERAMREYDVTAGLIQATDVEGLKTLDVILLGLCNYLPQAVAAAMVQAVRSGVGLLNEWWSGSEEEAWASPSIHQLNLADSPVYHWHECHLGRHWLRANVIEAHPILPGLAPGYSFLANRCGPVYRFMPGTRVLAEKERIIHESEHHIPGLGPARMPVVAVGHLGQGRVVLANIEDHNVLLRHMTTPGPDYMQHMIQWLAAGRTAAD